MNGRILIVDVKSRVGRLPGAEPAIRVVKLQSCLSRTSWVFADQDHTVSVLESDDIAGARVQRLLRNENETCDIFPTNDISFNSHLGGGIGKGSAAEGCTRWRKRQRRKRR